MGAEGYLGAGRHGRAARSCAVHLAPAGLTAAQRHFDYWGTQILAGLAVVILLGLVYPWGNVMIVRPLPRALAWALSLPTELRLPGTRPGDTEPGAAG